MSNTLPGPHVGGVPGPKLVASRPSLGSSAEEPLSGEQRKRMMAPITAGLITCAIFVGGAGIWASVFKIAGGVPVPGIIAIENNRKSVSQLDGGVVRDIRVHEGDKVTKGQVLMVMDDAQARAQVDVLSSQYDGLIAQKARLDAELAGSPTITWPPELLARRKDPQVASLIKGQETLFRANLGVYTSQVGVLNQRLQQMQSRTQGLQAQVQAVDQENKLVDDEMQGVDQLYQQGFAPKSRLLALQRSQADLVGTRGARVADIAGAGQAMGETQMQLAQIRQQRATQSADILRQVQSQIADTLPRLRAAQSVLDRTVIRSPADGEVLGLTQFTNGGVVRPGERLMDVVPQNTPLVARVNVKPDSIHDVTVGMKAQVKLVGFSRSTPNFDGRVTNVSADRLTNEKGESFFTAELVVDPAELKKHPNIKLMPGMPIQAIIVTGNRSIIEYLISPLTSTFTDSMHER